MKRALDAYRRATAAGASPSEVVAAVVRAHELERVELAAGRCRATPEDIAIARRLASGPGLFADEAMAVLRLADATAHVITAELGAPMLEDLEEGQHG